MSKRIAAILIAFLMQLNALFGFGGAATPADPADSYYDRDSVVDVIVELEQPALLESVSNCAERDALVDSIESNTQYQSILQAQRSLRERIEQTFSDADFSESYNYSFVTNGISLAIPYRFVDALKKLPGVKDVTLSTSFAAPREAEETALDAVYQDADAFTGIEQAHAAGYTGKGTVVAILDTGFELGHEAFSDDVPSPTYTKKDIVLKSAFGFLNTIVPQYGAHYISTKIPYRWDYADVDKGVHNQYSDHGTHVAGIVGAKSAKKTGTAPDAQLLLMKVFKTKKESTAKEYVILAALDDCVKLKADVVNMSLGSACGQEPEDIFTSAVVKRLKKAGVNVVSSAGNEASISKFDNIAGNPMNIDLFDSGSTNSPGTYEPFMSVASSAISGSWLPATDVISAFGIGSIILSSFSAWGPTEDLRLKPEITAPGSSIYSTIPENEYGYMGGTSMAAPYYAGVAALMKQYVKENGTDPGDKQTSEFVNALMMSTATIFRERSESVICSPRRQGAGFINVGAALETPAYLTQTNGVSRPKIELGEVRDGILRLSFQVHNLTDRTLRYRAHEIVLTEKYRKVGTRYDNAMTARLLDATEYTVTDDAGLDENRIVTVAPHGVTTVSMTVTVEPYFIKDYNEIFRNGFFLDGFVVLEDADKTAPTLSIPYMGFCGDWKKDMLFDYTIYDEQEPYLNGEWGLAVSDGNVYYPLGVNIFENGRETHIDTKYCAYSKNAYDMKKPYVTVSIGLLRNAKRMDFNLFTASGVFRYCGSTMLEYCRKTVNSSMATHGVLWGGKSGLVNGQHYVYKVSTRAENYNSGRRTIEFPFVVDNDAPQIVGSTYEVSEDGAYTLTVEIKDNHYVMGFQLLTEDDVSIGDVSFKGIEPENGVYTYTVDVSKMAKWLSADELQKLKLYVVDYAYNETFGEVSLSGEAAAPTTVNRASLVQARAYAVNKPSMGIDLTPEETDSASGPFSKWIAKLQEWN